MNLDWNKPIIMRWREGKAGGGKGGMYSERSFTIATGNDQVLIVDGTRVDDVRVYEDGIVPTVISRYGTGGGNVPMIFDNSDESKVYEPKSAFEENWAESEVKNALRANASKSSHAVVSATVRRLTPTELSAYKDFLTDGQKDKQTHRAISKWEMQLQSQLSISLLKEWSATSNA